MKCKIIKLILNLLSRSLSYNDIISKEQFENMQAYPISTFKYTILFNNFHIQFKLLKITTSIGFTYYVDLVSSNEYTDETKIIYAINNINIASYDIYNYYKYYYFNGEQLINTEENIQLKARIESFLLVEKL